MQYVFGISTNVLIAGLVSQLMVHIKYLTGISLEHHINNLDFQEIDSGTSNYLPLLFANDMFILLKRYPAPSVRHVYLKIKILN